MVKFRKTLSAFISGLMIVNSMSAFCSSSLSAATYKKSGIMSPECSWTIEDNELSVNDLNGNWYIKAGNGRCVYGGLKIEDYEITDWSVIEENIDFFTWTPEPPVTRLIITVEELSSGMGTNLILENVSDLIIYPGVKKISDNILYGFSNLSDVLVFNNNVELDNTGLGYNEDKSKKDNFTIHGYRNSKAQSYALENGFNFVAFDKAYDNYSTGDINSDEKFDVSDISELSLYLIGDSTLSEHEKMLADVDYDGFVTLADLAKLQQYLSKKIDSL